VVARAALLLAVAAIALAGAACGSADSSSPTLTPKQIYQQVRACLVKRGAFVRHSSDRGGGSFFGSDHTASGRWGSWSLFYVNGKVASVARTESRRLRQRPRALRAFRYCTRWPR
jgi:hypothetical protein